MVQACTSTVDLALKNWMADGQSRTDLSTELYTPGNGGFGKDCSDTCPPVYMLAAL